MRVRKLVPLLLSGIMIAGVTSVFTDSIYADSKEAYVEYNSGNLFFYYDSYRDTRSGETFDIPTDSTEINKWRTKSGNVMGVTFDSSFKEYKPTTVNKWFCDFDELASILGIENLDMSNVTDMSSMFEGCEDLTFLNLSSLDTSMVKNFSGVFKNCTALSDLDLSGWNMSAATDVSDMFNNCKCLTTVIVDGDFICCKSSTMDVDKQSGIFYNCTKLERERGTEYTEADSSNAALACADGIDKKTGLFTYSGAYAVLTKDESSNNTVTFYNDGCFYEHTDGEVYSVGARKDYGVWRELGKYTAVFDESFETFVPQDINGWFVATNIIDIRNLKYLNTTKITDFSHFFNSCGYLTDLNLSELDVSEATDISYMFANCLGLTSVDVSGWDTSNVKSLFYCFNNCRSLTSLDLSTWNSTNFSTLNGLFGNCIYLKVLDLSGWKLPNAKSVNTMFNELKYLETIFVDKDWSIGSDATGTPFYANLSLVGDQGTTFDVTKTGIGMLKVDGGSSNPGYLTLRPFELKFSGDSYVRGDMPQTATYPHGTSVTLPTCSCSKNYSVFYGWSDGTKVYPAGSEYIMPDADTELVAVWTEPYAVYDTDTKTVTVYYGLNQDENNIFVGDSLTAGQPLLCYGNCGGCEKVIFDESFKALKPVSTSIWFAGYSSIKSFEGLENLDTSCVTDMSTMFAGCSSITELDLSSFDIKSVTNMVFMFSSDSKLKTIKVNADWDISNVDATAGMISGCVALVGGNGTQFSNEDNNSEERVIIDTTAHPGLLTCDDVVKISYNANGAIGDVPVTVAMFAGETFELPSNPFTYEGYTFAAWSDGNAEYAEGATYTAGTSDTEILAKWDKIPTYKVTFAGGEGATGIAPASGEYYENDEITLPSCSYSRKGYEFTGWSSDNGVTVLPVGSKYVIKASNVEFTAQWEKLPDEPTPTPTTSPEPSGEPTPTNDPTPSPKPSGEPSGEPTPTVPPTTPAPELNVGDFINRCYEVALGREADEGGYEYWVSNLNNGQACGAQVGYGFIFSSEYTNKNRTNEEFVNDMYAMYFGREADEAGFKYWVDQLNNETAAREDIMAGFANSEEFFNLCGKYGVVCGAYIVGVPNDQQGGVNCFVARLYKVCLNRLPDQGGQAGWVQKLMNGEVSGSSCAYGFVFSPEFINMNLGNSDFVNYMYKAFFGREADEDGLNYWVEQLNAGTATREDIFAGFSGSAEFANLCASYGISA